MPARAVSGTADAIFTPLGNQNKGSPEAGARRDRGEVLDLCAIPEDELFEPASRSGQWRQGRDPTAVAKVEEDET